MQFWNELEGNVIEGYPLRRLVRSEGRTAWFDSETAPNQPATISLTESLTDADEVIQRLEAAKELKDPNLIAIGAIGRTHAGRTLLVYAVMEHADQDLSDVLRVQALSKEEVRQVAETLVNGLTAIHKRGMVHGRVEPASVLAVGQSVKLRSDCLQLPGSTRAGDVSGVGATIFQAFTQRKVPAADDPQINRLPAPFAEIVRNSLSARWGLQQIAAALRPPALGTASVPPAPAVAAAAASKPAPSVSAASKTAPPNPVLRVTEAPSPATGGSSIPPQAPLPLFAKESADLGDLHAGNRRPLALYAIVAIAVILLLAWLFYRPHSKVSAPPPAPVSTAPTPGSETPSSAGSAEVTPSPTLPRPAVRSSVAARSGSNIASQPVWRVVAYTYNHQDQAQHKADEVNQAHPAMQASVFAGHDGRGPYLVLLGGPMDRSEALKFRQHAVSAGLPQDCYAQNFSR